MKNKIVKDTSPVDLNRHVALIQIRDFLNFLRDAEYEFIAATGIIELKESEQQDIEHYLELHDVCPSDLEKLSAALTRIRRERREAKNCVELLAPIQNWYNDNQKMISSLKHLLDDVSAIECKQQHRNYVDRTDVIRRTL